MTSGVATVGVTYDGEDVQRGDLGIFLEVVRGLNESPDVRGVDIVVPGAVGRVARNRIADRMVIELRGIVRGGTQAPTSLPRKVGARTILAAFAASGSSSIEVESPAGLAVGSLVLISGGQRTVASITGNTLGLNTALGSDHAVGEPVEEVTAETTLAAGTVPGATSIVVVSANGIMAGDYLQIGMGASAGIREVSVVAGTTLTLSQSLALAHGAGEMVREVSYTPDTVARASFRGRMQEIRYLFRPTRSPASLVVSLEDGTTATIAARPTSIVVVERVPSQIAEVSVELESVAPDWVIT